MSAETELGSSFVEGWVITQILGEGGFSEVRLLVHEETGKEVAVKVVDLTKDAASSTEKEVVILRMLKHKNIIRFLGQRMEETLHYIFLEYASGGELFDRIEPDVGMPEPEAHNYFKQLVDGVEYLHSVGVTHRDLKPENLLLTERDTLKITDFGLATVFRLRGVERRLNKRCGTLPYVAPEILARDEYEATPADVWSCGVILVALLTGTLPWDSPTPDCHHFVGWRECRSWRYPPWTKIPNVALSLLRCMLHCQPESRATISRIKVHQWFMKDFSKKVDDLLCAPSAKRYCNKMDKNEMNCLSQPEAFSTVPDCARASVKTQMVTSPRIPGANSKGDRRDPLAANDSNRPTSTVFSFSQPAVLENLLISTQSQPSQQSQQNVLQKLVRRMTRFIVAKENAEALADVGSVCANILKFTVKYTTPAQLTISTIDCRRTPLIFKATAYGMNGKTLLDFRRSKGDGLEFKRAFMRIRELSFEAVDQDMLNSWTNAVVSVR